MIDHGIVLFVLEKRLQVLVGSSGQSKQGKEADDDGHAYYERLLDHQFYILSGDIGSIGKNSKIKHSHRLSWCKHQS